MTCIPGKIRTRLSDKVYAGKLAGLLKKEWDKREVVCSECDKTMKASSLTNHLEGVHGVYRSKIINKDLIVEDREPVDYVAETFTNWFHCPVEGCNYGLNNGLTVTPYSLCRHFGYQHFPDNICIPHKDNYPRCNICDMQASAGTINSERHRNSKTSQEGHKGKLQRKGYRRSALSLNVKFTAYSQKLETVKCFEYLGRLLTYDNNDRQNVCSKLKKAPQFWALISQILKGKNICVLRYAEYFTKQQYRRYHYTGASPGTKVRRNSIADFVATRPVYEFCKNGRRRCGTSHHCKWWCDQEISINKEDMGV